MPGSWCPSDLTGHPRRGSGSLARRGCRTGGRWQLVAPTSPPSCTRPATASSAPSRSPCTQRRPCGGSAGAAATHGEQPRRIGVTSRRVGAPSAQDPRADRRGSAEPAHWPPARICSPSCTPLSIPGSISHGSPPRATRKLWWLCPTCGHSWQTTPAVRAGGSGWSHCALEGNRQTAHVVETARSLAIKHPDIAAELHPTRNPGIDPRKLGARSGLRLWWRCPDCGHEWQAKVYVRTNGAGCPACRAMRPGPGGQTFADARPDLVAEWHPIRNGDLDPHAVSAHSARKVWWRCAECGREWQATVGARCRSPRGGCRQCTRARRQREPTARDVLRDPSPQTSGNPGPQASPRSGPARLRHAG
jgi:transposase-like protein